MTQVGETVSHAEFVNDDHSEATCPWHQEGDKSKKKLPKTDPDDDTSAMPPNDGGTLGRNLNAANQKPPAASSVWLSYKAGEALRYAAGRKQKVVRAYEKSSDHSQEEYELQYAPHHLIPGNESLKGSSLVPFMGDDESIADFAVGQSSFIKNGHSIDYDVNNANNGVWLPSPYALSNSNEWPAAPGIKVIKKRRHAQLAEATEDFKTAYVAASIEASGGRQFHMRHVNYSEEVSKILKAIAERLAGMADGGCPIASKEDGDGKIDPPTGLVGRLNMLSDNLRRLVAGPVWRPPLYTDKMTKDYATDLEEIKAKGDIKKIL